MLHKKKYAINNITGEQLFCKVTVKHTGVLFVDYYLPQYGFSIIWEKKDPYIRLHELREIHDGNRIKTIVTFKVHPTYWNGTSFCDFTWKTMDSAINDVFTKYIKTHV